MVKDGLSPVRKRGETMFKLNDIVVALPEPQRGCFVDLFRNIPPGIEDKMIVREAGAGDTLARMRDKASTVYFLLEGRVRAQDEQYSGSVYAFAEFAPPSLFGEFEAFADCGFYRGTLICVTACVLLALPTQAFLEWMREDHEALFMRTEQITKQLIGQASSERKFRFSPAYERVLFYLTDMYRKGQKKGICRIDTARQQMADETGFSVKTIQRCLNTLKKRGLISAEGRAIVINSEQYQLLLVRSAEQVK